MFYKNNSDSLKDNNYVNKILNHLGDLPIYISIDKDVLSKNVVETTWDQGDMKLKDLKEIVMTPINNDLYLYSHPGEKAGLFGKKYAEKIDIVFPALHGTYGEDGSLQGLFELVNIPYVGGGVLASSVGMDKILMKDVFKANELPVVDYTWFYRSKWEENKTEVLQMIRKASANRNGNLCAQK